jgi:flagellar motor component MotA
MPVTDLTPVSRFLFQAAELMRSQPVQSLEREQLRTKVYHCIVDALNLIVEDERHSDVRKRIDRELKSSIAADLKDLLGG